MQRKGGKGREEVRERWMGDEGRRLGNREKEGIVGKLMKKRK